MDYQTPIVEELGSASDLIQAFAGPHQDGDGYQFSQGFLCAPHEE